MIKNFADMMDFMRILSDVYDGQKVACVECKSVFENDDLAFIAETGECPYCHKSIFAIEIKE